jgi:hypothetical protein
MLVLMPLIDLADDTFVVADAARVAEVVADPARWSAWWPDLSLVTTRDRGPKGRQWRVAGALTGTAEIWLEPWRDGVVVHFFLRADPSRPGAQPPDVGPAVRRSAERGRRLRTQSWKRAAHALKDELEGGRAPGLDRSVKDPVAAADPGGDES